MNHSVLVTRPNYEYTTRYLSAWADKIIEFAKQRGDKVLDLDGERANRKEFESMIKRHKPSFIFLNGHGNPGSIAGQANVTLIEENVNTGFLKETIVYAVSCESAKKLGANSIEKGAKAYIGYSESFIFLIDRDKRTRPADDKLASLFLDPSNQVVISLLKGHSAEEAHVASQRFFSRNILKLLNSQSKQEDTGAVRFLFWDMRFQVCQGDSKASL